MRVLVFGQLKEIIGSDSIEINAQTSTDQLVSYLAARYPQLAALKYLIAVDKEVIQTNTFLHDGTVIALLPPYAGG